MYYVMQDVHHQQYTSTCSSSMMQCTNYPVNTKILGCCGGVLDLSYHEIGMYFKARLSTRSSWYDAVHSMMHSASYPVTAKILSSCSGT